MKFRFYSRKNGWVGSHRIAKYYYSNPIEDCLDITKNFVDLSGNEIVTKIKESNLKKQYFFDFEKKKLIEKIEDLSNQYHDWYYYPIDTVLTDARIYS